MTFRYGRLEVLRGAVLAVFAICAVGLDPARPAASDDFGDIPHVSAAVNRALEYERDGSSVPWTNAETGNAGEITVESTFFRDPETPCRTYRRTTERADGSTVEIFGTGCREPRGVWRLSEEPVETAEGATGTVEAEASAASSPPSRPDPGEDEPTSILLTEKPAPTEESTDRDGDMEASERPGGEGVSGSDEQTAWLPPVPRPKPQIAVIVTSTPTQSDE